MKRAFAWLNSHDIKYEFHDYKKSGISESLLKSWSAQVGWEKLLNTRGTTWRKLPDADKDGVDAAKAIRLGADIAGLAGSVLESAVDSTEAMIGQLQAIVAQLRIACFCTGSRNIKELRCAPLLSGLPSPGAM